MTTITSQETNPFTLVSPQLSFPSPQYFIPSLSSHSMFLTSLTSYSKSNSTSPKLSTASTITGQSVTLGLPKEMQKLPVRSRLSTASLESEEPYPTLIENVIERTDIFTSLVTTHEVPIQIATNAPKTPKCKLDLAKSEIRKSSERPGIRKIVPQRQRFNETTTTRTSSRPNLVTIISDTVLPSAAYTYLTPTFPTNASWVLPQTVIVSPETSRRTVRKCSTVRQSIVSVTNSLKISKIEATPSSQTFDVLPRAQDYTITTSISVVKLRKPMLFITMVSTKSNMTITTKSLKSTIFSIIRPESPQTLMVPPAMAPPSPNEPFSTFVPSIKSPESTQYLTSEYNAVNSVVSTQVAVTSIETEAFSLGNRRLVLSPLRPPATLPEMSMFSFLQTLTPTKTAPLITTNTHVMSTALLPLLFTSTAAQMSSLMSVVISPSYALSVRHEPRPPPHSSPLPLLLLVQYSLLSLQPRPSPQPFSPHPSSSPNLPSSSSSSLLLPQHSLLLPTSPLEKSPIPICVLSRSSYPVTIRQTKVRNIRSLSVDQCSSYSSKKTLLRYRSCPPSSRLIGRSRRQSLPKHSIYPQTFLKSSRTYSLRCKSLLEQPDERSHSTSFIPMSSLSHVLSSLNRCPILLANKTSPMYSASTRKTSLQTISLDLKTTPLREEFDCCSPSCTSSCSPSCSAILSRVFTTFTRSITLTTESVTSSTLELSHPNYPSCISPPMPSYHPPKTPPPSPTSCPFEKLSISSVDSSFMSPDLVTQAREISFSQQSAFKQNTMINNELLSSEPLLTSPKFLLHTQKDTPASARDFLTTSINLSLHDPRSSLLTYVSTLSLVSAPQLDSQQTCPNIIFPPLPLEPPPQRPPPPQGSPPPLTTTLTSKKTSTIQTCVKTSQKTPDSLNVPEPIKKTTTSTLKLSIALRSLENSPKRVSPTSASHSIITLSSSSNSPILVTSSATPTPPNSPMDKIRYI